MSTNDNIPQDTPDLVRRFAPIEIAFHWWQAIPYPVLMVTGGILLVRNLLGEHGGGRAAATAHKIAAAVWVLALTATLVAALWTRSMGRLWGTLVDCLRWRGADLVWLARLPLKLVRAGTAMPETGRFNPAQKLHLLALSLIVPGFIATGVYMLAVRGALLAWALHAALFVPALLFLLAHLFLALVNPSTRPSLSGMFSGYVSRRYAEEHHPGWAGPSQPARPHALVSLWAALLTGLAMAGAVIWGAWSYGMDRIAERAHQAGWAAAITPGPLIPAHERIGNCWACHTGTGPAPQDKCLSCHKTIAKAIQNKTGYHGTLTGRCGSCHREHGGSGGDLRQLDRRTFNHALAAFPLEGPHRKLDCAACHTVATPAGGTKIKFITGRGRSCDDCHKDIEPLMAGRIAGKKLVDPHPHTGRLKCATCHRDQAAVQPASGFAGVCANCHGSAYERELFVFLAAQHQMHRQASEMLADLPDRDSPQAQALADKIALARKATLHNPDLAMKLWKQILPPPETQPATRPAEE